MLFLALLQDENNNRGQQQQQQQEQQLVAAAAAASVIAAETTRSESVGPHMLVATSAMPPIMNMNAMQTLEERNKVSFINYLINI